MDAGGSDGTVPGDALTGVKLDKPPDTVVGEELAATSFSSSWNTASAASGCLHSRRGGVVGVALRRRWCSVGEHRDNASTATAWSSTYLCGGPTFAELSGSLSSMGWSVSGKVKRTRRPELANNGGGLVGAADCEAAIERDGRVS